MSAVTIRIFAIIALLSLSGCFEEKSAERPAPRELTREAIGHYCGMIVLDHSGPKAQVFVQERDEPYWFASVRDAFAFTKLPGEAKNISAIYVNDMSKAESWDAPGAGTWVDAKTARFVLGSTRKGGMGLNEAVPFSSDDAAAAFIARHGGKAVGFADVPESYVLGDGDAPASTDQYDHHVSKKSGGES